MLLPWIQRLALGLCCETTTLPSKVATRDTPFRLLVCDFLTLEPPPCCLSPAMGPEFLSELSPCPCLSIGLFTELITLLTNSIPRTIHAVSVMKLFTKEQRNLPGPRPNRLGVILQIAPQLLDSAKWYSDGRQTHCKCVLLPYRKGAVSALNG